MPRVAKVAPRGDFLDDMLGRAAQRRVAPRETIGVGGTGIFGGYIETREKDSSLTGTERYRTFSELLANIPIIAASVRLFLALVGKAEWKLEPADESPEAERLAELTDEILHGMSTPLHRVRRRAASYRFYGFSLQEWTAVTRDDGVLGFLDIEPRPQSTIERWLVDETGTVFGATQCSPQDGREIFLPRNKLLYVVDDSLEDSPEGLGLFRHIVEPGRRLLRYEQLEGFGFETDLRGIPIARVPHQHLATKTNLSQDQIAALEQPLRNFAKQHVKSAQLGLTLDSLTYQTTDGTGRPSNVPMWSVELMKGGSTSLPESHAAIERLKREIAVVFGTEHLLLGSDAKGSYALSADKANNLAMTVDSANAELCDTFRADVVGALFDINGWDRALMPVFTADKIQWRDIEQVTRALRDMASAGAVLGPDDPAINEVRSLLGLSDQPELDLAEDAALQGAPEEPEEPEEEELETGQEEGANG